MSLGSLTTTYTPAPSCRSALNGLSVRQGGFPFFHGPVTTDGCFPDRYDWATTKYYSPGICPLGYTSACSSTNAVGSVTETVVTCCPSSYACNSSPTFGWEGTYVCASSFSGTTSFPSIAVIASTGSSTVVSTVSFTLAAGLQSAFNAYGVQIRFQSTDFTGPTGTTTGGSLASQTGSGGGGGSGTGGLSTGTVAGIAIGCILAGIFLAAAIFFAFRSGKRAARRKAARDESAQAQPLQQQGWSSHPGSPDKLGGLGGPGSSYNDSHSAMYSGYGAEQTNHLGSYPAATGHERTTRAELPASQSETVELP